jgi:hypothetical protein
MRGQDTYRLDLYSKSLIDVSMDSRIYSVYTTYARTMFGVIYRFPFTEFPASILPSAQCLISTPAIAVVGGILKSGSALATVSVPD